MLLNRIKLCKALLKLAEIATDKGNLIYEGELAEGVEVFVDVNGDIVPAEDGEYIAEGVKLTIKDGKVASLENIEAEAPKEDPAQVEEKQAEDAPNGDANKVADLEAEIAEKDAKIKELEAKVAELQDQLKTQEEKLKMSADKPAKEKVKEAASPKCGLKFYQFQ